MASVRELLREAARRLSGDEARREAEMLLAHALDVTDAWLISHANGAVGATDAAAFRALIDRRVRGEPVAYLTGVRGFHALDLLVTPDVLIPRPETELLVDLALERIPLDAPCAVADLGTGSGAVALALAAMRPRARVVATDVSAAALAVARANAARLRLTGVAFVEGDWLCALGDARFDVVVANPPYVADGDPHLRRGDLRFEPPAALVAGVDGLDAIRVIIGGARAHLQGDGWLLIEHGFDQGAPVRALLASGGYHHVSTARDLGDRERVSAGRA